MGEICENTKQFYFYGPKLNNEHKSKCKEENNIVLFPFARVISSAGRCTVDGRMRQGILRFSCLGALEKLRRDNTNQYT